MSDDKRETGVTNPLATQLQEITYAFSDALLDLGETIERQMQGIALMAEDLAAVALDIREMQAGNFDDAVIGERVAEFGGLVDDLRQSVESLQQPEMRTSRVYGGSEPADELLLSARQALSMAYMNAVQQQQQLWITAQAVLTQGVTLILGSVPEETEQSSVRH